MKGHKEELNFTVSRSPWQRMVSVYREKCEERCKSCLSTRIIVLLEIQYTVNSESKLMRPTALASHV